MMTIFQLTILRDGLDSDIFQSTISWWCSKLLLFINL